MDFMVKNHRKLSKHYTEEKLKHHWIHHNRKLLKSVQLKEERKDKVLKLDIQKVDGGERLLLHELNKQMVEELKKVGRSEKNEIA